MKNTKHIQEFIKTNKNVSGIYAIICTKTWRSYIGSSVNIGRRIQAHVSSLRLHKHINKELQKDFISYSIDSMRFEVLELCNEMDLLELENKYFYLGYNLYNKNPPFIDVPIYNLKDQKRFWKKVNIKSNEECWNFKNCDNKYGTFKLKNNTYVSNRIAFLFSYNYLNNIICHSCNNKACCNPRHLYSGSYSNNTQDHIELSDKYTTWNTVNILRSYYKNNPNKKLYEIYQWYNGQHKRQLTKDTIISILSNSTWYDHNFEIYKHTYNPIRKYQTKLNWDIVNEIRKLWCSIKNKRNIFNIIIEKYKIDITERMINDIITHKYWKDDQYKYISHDEPFDSWSEQDYNYLKLNYGKLTITDISNRLNYCRKTVSKKIKQLNLRKV